MAGYKTKQIWNGCPCCTREGRANFAVEVWHKGNHGERELLETHCNQCQWSVDGEGNLRNPGMLVESINYLPRGKERL